MPFALRLHLFPVVRFRRVVWRCQRVAVDVIHVGVIHNNVDDLPPFPIRVSNGVVGVVLNASYHPLRNGRVLERDVARGGLRLFEQFLCRFRRQPQLRIRV